MLIKRIKRIDFIIFFLPVAIGMISAMYYFRNYPLIKLQLVIAGVVLYIAIALLHHHKDKSLSWEVMVEYIMFALFVTVMVQGLIF